MAFLMPMAFIFALSRPVFYDTWVPPLGGEKLIRLRPQEAVYQAVYGL